MSLGHSHRNIKSRVEIFGKYPSGCFKFISLLIWVSWGWNNLCTFLWHSRSMLNVSVLHGVSIMWMLCFDVLCCWNVNCAVCIWRACCMRAVHVLLTACHVHFLLSSSRIVCFCWTLCFSIAWCHVSVMYVSVHVVWFLVACYICADLYSHVISSRNRIVHVNIRCSVYAQTLELAHPVLHAMVCARAAAAASSSLSRFLRARPGGVRTK